MKTNGNINIITDIDGNKVVLVNDIMFKSRRSIDWSVIEKLLKEYVGKHYEIVETSEKVYVGSDFPDEFAHSKDTIETKGVRLKAKANLISALGKIISIANNKTVYPDYKGKHGAKAKNGWYRYDTMFGLPTYSVDGTMT